MRTRTRAVLTLALALGVGGVGVARAQAVPAGPCTYDRCALRYEEPWIVAGQPGTRVGRLGFLVAPHLVEYVRESDSALTWALRFERGHSAGQGLAAVGGLLSLGSFIWGLTGPDNAWGPIALGVGGVAFDLAGGIKLRIARRDMERAIWWYNRDLPR